jgi:two-component system NtrC family response regulator
MHILVVDDEKPVLELLGRLCAREGHEVTLTSAASEALGALRTQQFDLLLTDLQLPDLDGLALVRRARAMQPDITPIVITGHSGQPLEEVLQAGAADLLLKPFRAPELRARLKLADDQRRVVQQLKAQGLAIQTSTAEVIDGLQRELQDARQTVARLSEVVAGSDRTI